MICKRIVCKFESNILNKFIVGTELNDFKYSCPKQMILFNINYLFVCLFVCLGFYGISTFVGYLMPNPFLYK